MPTPSQDKVITRGFLNQLKVITCDTETDEWCARGRGPINGLPTGWQREILSQGHLDPCLLSWPGIGQCDGVEHSERQAAP